MVLKRILEFIFFSNYFYGISAVMLSIEASLQQRVPLNSWVYYMVVFLATILYYSYPYTRRTPQGSGNVRTGWYNRHYFLMRWHQLIIIIILAALSLLFIYHYHGEIILAGIKEWIALLIFPMASILYYDILPSKRFHLRNIGWLKPFVIGFCWAGWVTWYPVLFYDIVHSLPFNPGLTGLLLFIKNFMFITLLGILFDIKDHSADYLNRVRTFVVQWGLRKTLYRFVLPLAVIGLATFIVYALSQDFHFMKVLLNMIPFLLLLLVLFSFHRRRPLLYYLVVIDGLLLVKGICGSLAMYFF
jgi:hypothetical protein